MVFEGALLVTGLSTLACAYGRLRRKQAHTRRLQQMVEELRAKSDDRYVGRVVDKWLLTGRLGSGGMALVYSAVATDTLDSQTAVAVKLLRPKLSVDEEFLGRFQREIEISKSMQHPAIVRAIRSGTAFGLPYLVMEQIPGQTLRRALPSGGFPLAEALRLTHEIAGGLLAAHRLGVVHRDLKPENVMLTPAGQVKIMDLGLAKTPFSALITGNGEMVGTAAYTAPEVGLSHELLSASDQYSLGVLLFELLTGTQPFVGTPLVLRQLHLQSPPPSLRERKPELPAELERLLSRLLAKDPQDRYPSLQEVLEELDCVRRVAAADNGA